MPIVIDGMGGDYAPKAVVEGVVLAVKELDVDIALVGIQDQLEAELKSYNYPKDKIQIVHASEVVGMHEHATTPLRKKKDSSIGVGIKLLKEANYSAFVSAGNTGAVVAASTIHLGMLEGVERPAIGLVIPNEKGLSFIIDVGANADPKPVHLLQSAQMSHVYVRELLGRERPTIGLLNIGEEESKGTDFHKETYKLMEEKLPNFVGNVEASEVFSGKSDCIICDGFVGNVVLKVSEGLLESVGKLLKREVKKSVVSMAGALLMNKGLQHIKKLADYSEYGGAPLLGVNGLVMISHGRSSPKAIKNAIKATKREIEQNVLTHMATEIKRIAQ